MLSVYLHSEVSLMLVWFLARHFAQDVEAVTCVVQAHQSAVAVVPSLAEFLGGTVSTASSRLKIVEIVGRQALCHNGGVDAKVEADARTLLDQLVEMATADSAHCKFAADIARPTIEALVACGEAGNRMLVAQMCRRVAARIVTVATKCVGSEVWAERQRATQLTKLLAAGDERLSSVTATTIATLLPVASPPECVQSRGAQLAASKESGFALSGVAIIANKSIAVARIIAVISPLVGTVVAARDQVLAAHMNAKISAAATLCSTIAKVVDAAAAALPAVDELLALITVTDDFTRSAGYVTYAVGENVLRFAEAVSVKQEAVEEALSTLSHEIATARHTALEILSASLQTLQDLQQTATDVMSALTNANNDPSSLGLVADALELERKAAVTLRQVAIRVSFGVLEVAARVGLRVLEARVVIAVFDHAVLIASAQGMLAGTQLDDPPGRHRCGLVDIYANSASRVISGGREAAYSHAFAVVGH